MLGISQYIYFDVHYFTFVYYNYLFFQTLYRNSDPDLQTRPVLRTKPRPDSHFETLLAMADWLSKRSEEKEGRERRQKQDRNGDWPMS